MSTATGWDIPGHTTEQPVRRQPYADTTPVQEPIPQEQDADQAPTAPQETIPEAPAPEAKRNPVSHWLADMKADSAARKARRTGERAPVRWTREQPTSLADHLDFLLKYRLHRPGGRKGWGLTTGAPVVDGVHAVLYIAYGLAVGVPVTMACYALAWIAQRPGRFLLLVAAIGLTVKNLTVLAGS